MDEVKNDSSGRRNFLYKHVSDTIQNQLSHKSQLNRFLVLLVIWVCVKAQAPSIPKISLRNPVGLVLIRRIWPTINLWFQKLSLFREVNSFGGRVNHNIFPLIETHKITVRQCFITYNGTTFIHAKPWISCKILFLSLNYFMVTLFLNSCSLAILTRNFKKLLFILGNIFKIGHLCSIAVVTYNFHAIPCVTWVIGKGIAPWNLFFFKAYQEYQPTSV